MNNQQNPILVLTPEQTLELREIWEQQKSELHPDDYRFIKVKLSRSEAVLSQKQAYRMMMTLAETDYEPIPEWLIALFDPQEVRWTKSTALGTKGVALQFVLYGALYCYRKWLKEIGFVVYFLNTKKPIPEPY